MFATDFFHFQSDIMMSLHIYQDSDGLAEGLAGWIAANINLVLKNQSRYSFVLSGGSTPKKLYHILAAEYANAVDWKRVDFFWGDERYVPFTDDRSNARMAYDSLLTPLGIPGQHIFKMPTAPSPQEAADQYQSAVKSYLDPDGRFSFDLSLLGMGDDGHTLSIFPGSRLLREHARLVSHIFNPNDQLQRITLLPGIVNRSRTIVFMVQGAAKASMLQQVLSGSNQPEIYPSQIITAESGQLMWFIDEAAASRIISKA